MQIDFKYKSNKYVIRMSDFIVQISKFYNRNYYLRHIDMGEYTADIFVSDDNIKTIEYVGTDLIYYALTFKNGMKTNKSKDDIINNPDFLEAKIIENNLIVLEMPHYNYLPIISGYSVLTQEKKLRIDPDENQKLLINKLQKIFKKEILEIKNFIYEDYKERVYNGDIEYYINSKRYKTTDRLIYKSCGYNYVYVPAEKTVLIIT